MLRRAVLVLALLLAPSLALATDRAGFDIVDQSAVTMTATTTGTAHLVRRYTEALVFVDVTAEVGTMTLDLTVEVAPTSTGPWVTHPSGTFTQITGVGSAVKALTNIGRYMRLKYTLAGTTSFTLSSHITLKN